VPWDPAGVERDLSFPEGATAGAGELGLAELLESALVRNPSTRVAWEQARQRAALWRESKSSYWPQIDAGIDVLGQHTETESVANTRRKTRRGAGASDPALTPELAALSASLAAMSLPEENERVAADSRTTTAEPAVNPYLSLTWLLFDFGAREAGVDAFKQSLLASNFVYNREIQRVVRDVQRGYFLWDGSRAALEVQDNLVANARKSVELVDIRFKAGLTAKTDLLQAQQFLARTEFDRETVVLNLQRQRGALLAAAGLRADSPVGLREGDRSGVSPRFADGIGRLVENGLAARPDLAARLASVRAADSDLRRARRELWPRISLFGGVEGQIAETETVTNFSGSSFSGGALTEGSRTHSETLDSFVGIGASVNLFDGFAKYQRIDRAQSARNQATAELLLAELDVAREVWDAWQGYLGAKRQSELGRKLVAASRESYDAVTEAYRTGLKSILDVIDATDDLGRAELSELEARYRALLEAVEIAYSLGETAIPAVAVGPAPSPSQTGRKR
jgi:outer membrane protein TolC